MEDFKQHAEHQEDESLVFMRHLNEIDDLEQFGRDAPIYESEENARRIEQTSDLLVQKQPEDLCGCGHQARGGCCSQQSGLFQDHRFLFSGGMDCVREGREE